MRIRLARLIGVAAILVGALATTTTLAYAAAYPPDDCGSRAKGESTANVASNDKKDDEDCRDDDKKPTVTTVATVATVASTTDSATASTTTTGRLASTGSSNSTEIWVGIGAVLLGLVLVTVASRRRSGAPAGDR